MKKFTGNFLLGEHSFGSVLRRIGLSMVGILMAVGVFAQPQETYHVWAENVSDCYRYDNTYEVDISMRDFIKIDTFTFELNFDEDVLSYTGLAYVIDTLQGGSGLVVTDNGSGKLTMKWGAAGDPLGNGTIGETAAAQDEKTVVFTLKFELNAYPLTYGPVNGTQFDWDKDLTWGAYEVWNNSSQISEILTDITSNGSIVINQAMTDVTVDEGAADCDGNDALAIVTDPAEDGSLKYSFNGKTFTTNAEAVVEAPSTENTVRVLDGACVSYIKEFDVTAPEVLDFEVAETVYTDCPGGLGDIEIVASGGTPAYTYYIIPMEDWSQVVSDLDQAINADEGMSVVADYGTTNDVIERMPGSYYVAVQDANECQDMRQLGWWDMVTVIDNKDPWYVEADVVDLTCYDIPDGEIAMTFSGATPFVDGYNVWFNDTYKGRLTGLELTKLDAGSYSVLVSDSLGCDWDSVLVVTEPDPITFEVEHTDASCNDEIGTITILTETVEGGTGNLSDYWWVYSTSPDFTAATSDTILAVDGGIYTTATQLPPAVYYIRVFDAFGCFDDYKNINEDNAVKVLTTEFEVNYDDVLCYSGTTAQTTTDVSIDIITGAGNHVFSYGMHMGASTDTTGVVWQASNVFADVFPGEYTFFLYDETIGCVTSWTKDIERPDRIRMNVLGAITLPPTCIDNTDGNLAIRATGGTPFVSGDDVEYFKYKMDKGSWIQTTDYTTFAVDTAAHWIYLEDANGCVDSLYWRGFEEQPNYIEFQDTIETRCTGDMINLFNAQEDWITECDWVQTGWLPWQGYWDCETIPVDTALLDMGFATGMWTWYGHEDEHDMGTDVREYTFWTSADGWQTVTIQGEQQQRFPKLYWSATTDVASEIIAEGNVIGHTTTFGDGTYWIVGRDEWGCISNVEEVEIYDPLPLEIEVNSVGAGCDGSTDGQITLEAFNGRWDIPNMNVRNNRYQYVLTQQPEIFANDNWEAQVTWVPFVNGDFNNDSLAVISVQDGTYWLAVRDYCGVENPSLIQFAGPIVITGADAIDVDDDMVTIGAVTCVVYGEDTDYDGSITGLLEATSGGFGSYTFTLDLINDVDYPEWDGDDWPMVNTTGDFMDLPGGEYELTIVDDSLGCMGVFTFDVPQPDPLRLDTKVVYPSCFDTHDGILRYIISGGNEPYMEATNNVGMWETPSDIPAYRWVNTESEAVYVEEHDVYIFDRRVREGIKQIWIKDAKGCIYGPIEVDVKEPAQLGISLVDVVDVSCNDQDELYEAAIDDQLMDGEITVDLAGGWNMDDKFDYYVELWLGNVKKQTKILDLLDEVTFTGLAAGDYTVKLYEYNDSIWDNPVITYQNYFTSHEWFEFAPYQNPYLTTAETDEPCYTTLPVTVGEPDAITYDPIDWRDVKCYNTHSGEIYVPNITGGTPGIDGTNADFDGYLIGLEGPVDYDATLQSNWATNYYAKGYYGNDSIYWFQTITNEFTFDNLIWGHYTVHIQDANGCWIYKESGEIENPDTLMITRVQLVEHAKCYGGLGKIQIDAVGGSGEYMYAVDSTLVPDPGSHLFPNDLDLDAYLAGLNWQVSDTFEVHAATWIGYVKDTINDCITGFATFENGAPVMHHRVTVDQADPVIAEEIDYTPVVCYGEANGEITIGMVDGGNGGAWRIDVTGTDYDGNPVEEIYTSISSSTNITLDGLPASTNETDEDDMGPEDYYTILVYDHEGCVSEAYYQYITQPEEFVIQLKDKQNAFICPNDQAGIFEIDVVSGGNPFGTGADDEPQYMYKWEAYSDASYEEAAKIDSLSDDIYGFAKTFLGYADIYYRVWAIDALDCETSRDTFIQAPEPVTFTVQELTCFDEGKASARFTAMGTEGREFRVKYQMFEDNVSSPVVTSDWFTNSIDLIEEFSYDNENIADVHYLIWVEDTLGCISGDTIITFDYVQNKLIVSTDVEQGECTSEVTISVTGGTAPYEVSLNGEVITDMVQVLSEGTYVVSVVDAHLRCTDNTTVVVVPVPVERETTVETYIGEETAFMDVESGIDTMLAEGVHVLPYMFGGCERTLTVTVEGIPMPATIIEIQGEADASTMIDKVVVVTGTVTGVAPGEGFYMQDANAAWGGIWVAYSATTTGGIQVGNGVKVVGSVAEVADVTTLNATEVMFVSPVLTVVPVVVASPSAAEDEMYESVLVTVQGARASAADEGNGEWVIFTEDANDVIVNDLLYDSNPTAGNYYNVTGIVNARLETFKLEPRMSSDIVDLTATAIDPELNNVQFKVYPNPFNDRIMIDNNDKLTRVIVSNVAGQRVIDVEYPSHEIRTANLVSGVYFVSLITEEGIAKTERIVKR